MLGGSATQAAGRSMAQILLVIGEPGQAAGYLRKGLQALGALCPGEWTEYAPAASVHLAVAGTLASPRSEMVQLGVRWLCAAGQPFYRGKSGGAGLTDLGSALPDRAPPPPAPLQHLEGSFAIAFGNAAGVWLITDRIGTLQIYRASPPGATLVCTSSLALAGMTRPEHDITGCREFLGTGTIFEDRTLWLGIRKLGPAGIYDLNGARPGESKYWDLRDQVYGRAAGPHGVEPLAEALQQAVGTIFENYPRPVFDLTGGYDSRTVVGAALRAGRRPEAVVVGGAADADVRSAERIARLYGLRLTRLAPSPDDAGQWWSDARASLGLCDGEFDLLEYARVLHVHRRLLRDFDASVNGSNGEICKGYWWELLFPFTGRRGHFDESRIARGRFASDPGASLLLRDPGDLVEHFTAVIRRANQGWEDLPNSSRLDNVYLTLRMQRWQGRIASATSRLWPCLSPFLFSAPMEAALATPPAGKIRHRLSRRLIEHLDPALARLPLAQGYPALPLRPSTAHLFLPLAAEIAGKSWRKLVRRPRSAPGNPVRALWDVPEIRDLLRPDAMITALLYDSGRLRAFLDASRGEAFGAASSFGRVLTLEAASRACAGC
jgi:hypothetical protein